MSANVNPEDNERWLSDGNCTYCRRKKYCSKACTAQKRRKEAIIRAMVRNMTGIGQLKKAVEGKLNESIFQGAIDLLFENHVLSPASLLMDFKRHGISLYPNVIEELLYLKKGTLDYEEKVVPLFKIKNNNTD